MTGPSGGGLVLAVALMAIGAPAAAAGEAGLLAYAPAIEAPLPAAPAILLHAPSDGGSYVSPLGIDIGFRPAPGSEIDLNIHPEGHKKAKAAFAKEHAPFLQALAKFEKDALPARLAAWEKTDALKKIPWEIPELILVKAESGARTTPSRSEISRD